MLAYALTIFTGAFLLFQVQPLIGKFILPWFGGGPGVWTTCLLFFQALLLGGYAYAHYSTSRLTSRSQVVLQTALVVTALALLPIAPGDRWKPSGGTDPTLQILWLLTACLGVPYLVLSSTGPLIQQWFSRANPRASPYRLYALSNLGSLLALLSYPFLVEPHLTRKTQASLWSWGMLIYALGCGWCAVKRWKAGDKVPAEVNGLTAGGVSGVVMEPSLSGSKEVNPGSPEPSVLQTFLWLMLPACASALLMATTNKICQDVAVIPFLWIVPLALYLLSFIICFDSPRWYRRNPFTLLLIGALAGLCWALLQGSNWAVWQQVLVYSAGLFICCMVCHGELYRLRPTPEKLTRFYLLIAAGGALGGLFVAVVAPVVFTNYFELHWGMMACALLFLVVCMTEGTGLLPETSRGRKRASWQGLACTLPLAGFAGLDWGIARFAGHTNHLPKGLFLGFRAVMWAVVALLIVSWVARGKHRSFRHWRLLSCVWLVLGVLTLSTFLWKQAHYPDPDRVFTTRNFYGVLTVYEHRRDDPDGHHLLLQHGRITHGLQFLGSDQQRQPSAYYGPESGVGLAFEALVPAPRRIGLVGLGTGTLAAYAHAGDYVRIYEINPEVERLARSRFTYLQDCKGKVEVALGDARLSMERESPQQFDLLALDAFSSDAIPVHLLTREAFETYERHLKPGGIIAVHISNHFLDLQPVVLNLARHFKYRFAVIDYDENDEEWWQYSSTWVLLTHNGSVLDAPGICAAALKVKADQAQVGLWTDDFSSLFEILK
jgi:SAM-dependent methyltransferase